MQAMADLISEITRLSNKCNQAESKVEQIKQEIRLILYGLQKLPDGSTFSIDFVREMLEDLLVEEEEKHDD